MSKSNWGSTYVVPSIALSGAAAGMLVWHLLDPAAKVDAWTVTLLVVGFLPWLRSVFESIELPGGGAVKWRQLEVKQAEQAEDIRTLKFLTANFLTGAEKLHLEKLAANTPFQLRPDMPNPFYDEMRRLRSLGFIRQKGQLGVTSMRGTSGDVREFFEISERGRVYLDLLVGSE